MLGGKKGNIHAKTKFKTSYKLLLNAIPDSNTAFIKEYLTNYNLCLVYCTEKVEIYLKLKKNGMHYPQVVHARGSSELNVLVWPVSNL